MLTVDDLEEHFVSKRWVTCHQIHLFRNQAGHKQRKYYGAMFTFMSSRAVHIEITNNMSTDSFILALRRLISQRGNVRMIRADNGTNFVGANIELRKAFNEMNHIKIDNFLMI